MIPDILLRSLQKGRPNFNSVVAHIPAMEIVFIGTGGGRINLIKQVRGTGGFRINSRTANIHVDPGPGALVHSVKLKQDPLKLDAVIVTHNHIDHMSDAMAMIEGMSNYGLRKKGVLIGSVSALEGEDRSIGSWHQSRAALVYAAKEGEKKAFESELGSFEMEIKKMEHDESSAFGFILGMDGKVLGHITDTEYFEGLGSDFQGCDCLVVNCIKPEADKYHGHLKSSDVVKILKEARPNTCIITHMGMKMLRAGAAKEAERIEQESGVKTIAAKDGMKFPVL
jgi:ribonuclease BN (tRNA processing enzyme)